MTKIRDHMMERNRGKIAINCPEPKEVNLFRKICEIIFSKTDIKVDICIPKRHMGDQENQDKRKTEKQMYARQRRISSTDALVIRKKDRTYAKLLKEVREEIVKQGMDMHIDSIRETRKGDMLVSVEKGGKNFTTLKTKIETKMDKGSTSAIRAEQDDIFHIHGIDAITTAKEIEEAICKATNIKHEDVRISNLRPAWGSCQIATLRVCKGQGSKMEKLDRVTIGVTRCHIRRRRELKRCYRCWSYNHLAAECTGPDRTKLCMNCAEEGHLAKECSQESFCPLCNRQGHRTDSSRCPKHRNAIAKQEEKAETKHENRIQ